MVKYPERWSFFFRKYGSALFCSAERKRKLRQDNKKNKRGHFYRLKQPPENEIRNG